MSVGSEVRAGKAFVELYVKDSKFVRGLANAQRRLRAFGDAAMMVGRQIATASGIAIAGFAVAATTFAGFEDQMKAVQAVTQSTADEYQRLYDLGKKLGRTTSFTAAQVAGGEKELGRAGFSPKEIEASTAATLNLARATDTELPRAAEIAAGTLRAFSLEADQMTRVADVMTATANNSAQTLEELGESMKYAAPVAYEFGMSLEQTAKALGVMANMQIKGSMAGTSLRMIMLQASDPAISKRIADIAGQEALAALQAGRLGDAMHLIGEAMSKMSSMQRIALGTELFGARAVSGGLKLARTDFPALTEAIDNAGGAAQRTAETMDSGLGGASRRLWSAIEGLQIAIGEATSGLAGDFAEGLTNFIGKLSEAVEGNQEFVVGLLKFTVTAAGVGAALMGLGVAANLLAAGLGAIKVAALFLTGPFGVLTLAVGALATAWVNAKIQGISFGESVLDLTHKITGLENAYTRLVALQEKTAKESKTIGDAWKAYHAAMEDSSKLGEAIKIIGDARSEIQGQQLPGAQQRMLDMEKEVARAEELAGMYRKINDTRSMRKNETWRINRSNPPTFAERNELFAMYEKYGATNPEKLLEAVRKKYAAAKGDVEAYMARIRETHELENELIQKRNRITSVNNAAFGAGKAMGEAFSKGFSAVISGTKKLTQPIMDALKARELRNEFRRIQAEGITDSRSREESLLNIGYDERRAELKGKGASKHELEQLERNRQEALKNIRDRYARESADQQKSIAYDTEAARIEATMSGSEKELALLRLRQKREREELKKSGLDPALLAAKHGFEEKALQRSQALQSSLGPRGTFSASAVSGMGNGAINRLIKAAETSEKYEKEIVAVLGKNYTELKRLNLEASP